MLYICEVHYMWWYLSPIPERAWCQCMVCLGESVVFHWVWGLLYKNLDPNGNLLHCELSAVLEMTFTGYSTLWNLMLCERRESLSHFLKREVNIYWQDPPLSRMSREDQTSQWIALRRYVSAEKIDENYSKRYSSWWTSDCDLTSIHKKFLPHWRQSNHYNYFHGTNQVIPTKCTWDRTKYVRLQQTRYPWYQVWDISLHFRQRQ